MPKPSGESGTRVILVTGASSGIGAAIAGHLAARGACVYGTSRSSSVRRARGHCVIVGSMAGFLSKPFEAFYCASKHALEAYAEVLRYEVEPFGVRVVLLEPGYIKTALAKNATSTAACMAEYRGRRGAVTALLEEDLRKGAAPERVAEMVAQVLDDEHPPLRRLIGADARRLRALRSILPDRWFDWGLRHRFR